MYNFPNHCHRRGSLLLQDGVLAGWFKTALDGPASLPVVVGTATEIASGMAFLHSRGIVHGDLSSGAPVRLFSAFLKQHCKPICATSAGSTSPTLQFILSCYTEPALHRNMPAPCLQSGSEQKSHPSLALVAVLIWSDQQHLNLKVQMRAYSTS